MFSVRSPFLAALAVIVLLAQPLASRGGDLSLLLSGNQQPLAVRLKDLSAEWRCVTVRASTGAGGNVAVNVSGNATGSNSQNNLLGVRGEQRAYVTKGQTVSASGEIYLVAYRLPTTGLDLQTLLQAAATKRASPTVVLTPESSLPLCLLNVRAIASLEDIRVFDMNREINESEKAAKTLAGLLKAAPGAKAPKPAQKKSSR
jgi:hypothetical protein